MKGTRCATACFITRAHFTTCGRNILPAPNRSPTTFMPSISGPSITWIGPRVLAAAPPRCPRRCTSVMPLTSACDRRSSTVPARQARSSLRPSPCALTRLGELTSRSVASGAAVEHHVLDALAQLRVELVVDAELAGVDDAHRHAGADRVVQEHGVDRLAHRVVAAEGEATRCETPPETFACGRCCADPARRLDEVDARSCCAPRCPVAIAKMFGSKMMSSGGKPTCSVSSL